MKKRLVLLALAAAGALSAQAIRTNAGFRANSIPRNDDGSGPRTRLGFTANFFGKFRSEAYVNNNGNITFDNPLSTYTPFGLTSTRREIIAAFFADVDTRGAASKLVTYGQDTIDGRRTFGANYIDVGYYASHDDKQNRFQIVLIDRSDIGEGDFDIEFNYERIVWETGDASGGTGGYGGVPASAGWSNGTGEPGTFFELDGSLVPGSFLDGAPLSLVRNRLNSRINGRYLFRARNGAIQPPLGISTGCPLPSGSVNVPYSITFEAVGGRPPYRWSMLPDPGASMVPGLSFSSSGRLSGTPTRPGSAGFTVYMTSNTEDGEQTVARACSITVEPPLLTITSACPLPRATAGQPYSQTLRATGGTAPWSWSVVDAASLPPGLTLNSEGTLSGMPSAPGNYTFVLTAASNPADGSLPVTRSCGLTVAPAELDLTSTCALPEGTLGVPYSRDLTVSGGRPPYRWSAIGELPAGLTLTDAGRLSGTPSAPGTSSFAARVTDGAGRQLLQSCTLVVSAPVLSITASCPLPQAEAGQAYSQTLSASGGTGPYTWSSLGPLPAGLSLSPDGVLSGTPEGGGAMGLRLMVTDAENHSATRTCALTVMRASFGLDSCPVPPATMGEAYGQWLRASGGRAPFLYVSAGNVPPGLRLTTAGRLSGTPSQSGSFTMAVQLTDSDGQSTTQPCTVRVNPSPLVLASGCPLPAARVAVPYSTRMVASGGTSPYHFNAEGPLPAGVMLNGDGTVEGTPTASGNFEFSLRLTDAQGRFALLPCGVSVALPELPLVRIADVPLTFSPAAAGPRISVELSRAYSLPVQGRLNLTLVADTGSADGMVNRADPRVRLNNGARSIDFTVPAGSQRFSADVVSTGTVAMTATASVTELRAGGNRVTLSPAPRVFRVPRSAPAVTDACYVSRLDGFDAVITGYTTTRQLNGAEFLINAGGTDYREKVDVRDSAAQYFGTDDAFRNGGAFTLTVPFGASAPTPVTSVSVTLSNSEGAAASKVLQRCP
ncbi:MAG TPA: Ig domain-containing protein [Bryobacteraceae bacterium]|nr:Ig domain-containing protein [Bryobacteraceae bacterium]